MKTISPPYPECPICTHIEDCRHLIILDDGMGTKVIPDECRSRDEKILTKRVHQIIDKVII